MAGSFKLPPILKYLLHGWFCSLTDAVLNLTQISFHDYSNAMDLDSYELIASSICWKNFDKQLVERCSGTFSLVYEYKLKEYYLVEQQILSSRKKRPQVSADHTLRIEEEEELSSESPVTFIRKQILQSGKKIIVENDGSARDMTLEVFLPSTKDNYNVGDLSLGGETNNAGQLEQSRSVEKNVVELDASAYDMTLDKVFLPSTKDNYNVDDLSSGDETDNEDQPRKKVPSWAESVAVTDRILSSLISVEQCRYHFGRMVAPTIEMLFKGHRKLRRNAPESMEWESADV